MLYLKKKIKELQFIIRKIKGISKKIDKINKYIFNNLKKIFYH